MVSPTSDTIVEVPMKAGEQLFGMPPLSLVETRLPIGWLHVPAAIGMLVGVYGHVATDNHLKILARSDVALF